MRKHQTGSGMGKGYYIALILCAVAIGISGYLYYSHSQNQEPALQDPDMTVGATLGVEAPKPTEGTQPNQPTQKPIRKPLQTAAPVEGEAVAVYAMDRLDYNPTTRDWRVHNGVDYAAQEGTAVCAAADGTVYTVYESETMGMTVVLRHEEGYTTTYASLDSDVSVKAGDTVAMGQKLGTVGQTALLETAIGPHVHFSVTCNDEPMDPAQFLAQ